jgi:hypothetical protein
MPYIQRDASVSSSQLVKSKAEREGAESRGSRAPPLALVDIGRHFSAEHDPRAVLQHVCAAALDVTFAKHVVLALYR